MKTALGLAIFPLLCMGVTILTALIIIFALRRGTRKINDQVEQAAKNKPADSSPNTRFARADLQSQPGPKSSTPSTTSCPACGGENSSNSTTCAFCGRKL